MKLIAIFVGLLTLEYARCSSVQTIVNCTTAKLDIIFVLDSSGSVGDQYPKEKEFIQSIAREFTISEDGNHAGVSTFSNYATISIRLGQFSNIDEFDKAVDGIDHMNGGTRIDLGLDSALENFNSYGRKGTERLIVLLTDGVSTGSPITKGEELRKLGISIVAIAIGKNVDVPQLKGIVGEENVHLATNFDVLKSKAFVQDLKKVTCQTVYIVGPDGRRFKFYNKTEAFEKASTFCTDQGANLVLNDDSETDNFLKNTYGTEEMWIGAKYDETLKRWFWTNGQRIEDSFWDKQPFPRGSNLCLTSLKTQKSCTQTLPFICQKGMSKPDPPILTQSMVNGSLTFACKINIKNFSTPVTYEVIWLQSQKDGSLTQVSSDKRNTANSKYYVVYLKSSDKIRLLSKNTQCQVRAWFDNKPDEKSVYSKSIVVFAGVKVEPPVSDIREGGSLQLNVSLTIPLICESSTDNCSLQIEFISKGGLFFTPCSFILSRTIVHQIVTVTITSDLVDTGDRSVIVRPRVVTNGLNADWKNHSEPSATVKIINVPGGRCSSTGDPHMRTFDGVFFDHYRVGYYTFVESTSRLFKVHVGTFKCGSVSCNCGVAVREGVNVLVVDMCRGKQLPKAYYLTKSELDDGTFIQQSANGKNFKLKFSSGAFVTFKVSRWSNSYYGNIDVQVPPADFKYTKGLCGLLDGKKDNDMKDKNGAKHGFCGGKQGCPSFTESWKLKPEESLFYYKSTSEISCLPKSIATEGSCATVPKVSSTVSPGYRKMLSPAHLKCKNTTLTGGEIVTEKPDLTGIVDKTKEPHENQTVPTTGPTGERWTEANNYCKNRIVNSQLYKVCINSTVVGISSEIDGFIMQCVTDIQILDDKQVALESAMSGIRSYCEELLERKNSSKKEDLKLVCPNDCSLSGVCTDGFCTCNEGFASEDCSVNRNQPPVIQEAQTRKPIYCDIRSGKCGNVPISALDLVKGNITCKFEIRESVEKVERYPAPYIQLNSIQYINTDATEVTCTMPNDTRVPIDGYSSTKKGFTFQEYNISLSNNGISNFSTNWISYIVYDSKCMSCGNGTCALKSDACNMNGYCFAKSEADPDDSKCKICDAARSTSKFVYRQTWTETDVKQCKERYIIECHELYVTGYWEKDMFGAHQIEMHLNDAACKTYQSNETHVWITANFKECGSKHRTTNELILQENTAHITITRRFQNLVDRFASYPYKMQCQFDRTLNVSKASSFNSSSVYEDGGDFNVKGKKDYNATMDFYTSSSFLVVKNTPLQVTTYQPIYIGIREANNSTFYKNYKFVVNRCYATPTKNIRDFPYMFFTMKCPIDPSFKIVSQSTDHFNFQIESFTFIQLRKSIYITCELYICPVGATSQACTQSCSIRQRRAVADQSPIEKIKIRSEEITFKVITTCKEKTCPGNSKCLELYPAECRCDEGYVNDIQQNTCIQTNEVLVVADLHFDITFISTYSDTNSADFLNLARMVEKELIERLQRDNGIIIGVKVIRARPGSVILDLLLMYGKNVTINEAENAFRTALIANTTSSGSSMLNKVKQNIRPSVTIRGETKIIFEDGSTVLILSILIPIVVVLTILYGALYKLRRRSTAKKYPVTSHENTGVEADIVMKKQ